MKHKNAYRLLHEQYLNKAKYLLDNLTDELVLRVVQEAESSDEGVPTQKHFTRDMFMVVLDSAERDRKEKPDIIEALSYCGLKNALALRSDKVMRYLEKAMAEARTESAKGYYVNEHNNVYLALISQKAKECMELIDETNAMELKNLAADTTGLGYIQDMFESSVSTRTLEDYVSVEQAAISVAMDLGLDLEGEVFSDERMTRGLNAAAEKSGWPKGCILAMRDAWRKQQADASAHAQ